MSKNQDIQQAGTQPMTGFLLPFVEHRSTTTLYGSISVPNGGGIGGHPENVYA
ncbi:MULTISPECIES: hypothetical protein [unclassified Burkholderia]|uniref:hypothetical protein n=1 Tax=unclassified Burkholderia TaxID=2613784 RepID=UPI00158B799C|nr:MULTISPECIES: hypothetical protein [unclassified Burkholderia]